MLFKQKKNKEKSTVHGERYISLVRGKVKLIYKNITILLYFIVKVSFVGFALTPYNFTVQSWFW